MLIIKSRLIKKAVFLAVILMLTVITAVSAAEARFPDTVGHWSEGYVESLADKGIISGMGDGLFHPDEKVTTAQFTAMVLKSAVGAIPAIDGHWASGYLAEALRLKMIEDYDVTEWDRPIMRRSVARIGLEALHCLFGETDEPDIKMAEDNLLDLYLCRTCVWNTGQFYVKGIMIGRPDGKFYGDDYLTRAEAAIVITKMIDPSSRTPQRSSFE